MGMSFLSVVLGVRYLSNGRKGSETRIIRFRVGDEPPGSGRLGYFAPPSWRSVARGPRMARSGPFWGRMAGIRADPNGDQTATARGRVRSRNAWWCRNVGRCKGFGGASDGTRTRDIQLGKRMRGSDTGGHAGTRADIAPIQGRQRVLPRRYVPSNTAYLVTTPAKAGVDGRTREEQQNHSRGSLAASLRGSPPGDGRQGLPGRV